MNHPILAAPKQGWGGGSGCWGTVGSARGFVSRLGRLGREAAAKSQKLRFRDPVIAPAAAEGWAQVGKAAGLCPWPGSLCQG